MDNNNMNNMNINDADFSMISCEATRDMCFAIRQLGLWGFMRDFEDDGRGFMFSNAPEVVQISRHPLVDRHGHSGASFGICCRNVQFIAKNGIGAWCARFGVAGAVH
jgi:hypothetical protein